MQKQRKYCLSILRCDDAAPNGFELRETNGTRPSLPPSVYFNCLTAWKIAPMDQETDDYITKPFTEELFARIEAVLRRVKAAQERGREEVRESAQRDMENLKREILQNFHHELRTPLSNIIMPLELVVNNKFENPEEQIQFVRTALSSVDRLESLVTDFILTTNIDHGDLNRIRQSIDINSHILLPIQKRLDRYKAKGLEFIHDIKGQGQIMAPRREFTHAVVHLVDNAFKFSPDGGKIKFTFEIDTNDGAIILVEDEGPGIPEDLREKVFERYYQISQGDTREHDGLGVGLFIARAVFSSLGGNVQF
jgi:signal transduction histidine kinase